MCVAQTLKFTMDNGTPRMLSDCTPGRSDHMTVDVPSICQITLNPTNRNFILCRCERIIPHFILCQFILQKTSIFPLDCHEASPGVRRDGQIQPATGLHRTVHGNGLYTFYLVEQNQHRIILLHEIV